MLRPAAFALAVALLLAACEAPAPPKPNAIGDPGEIIVVADSATWDGPVGDALRATLGASVAPPLGGLGDFRLTRHDLTNEAFRFLRTNKNLIFAAALDDTSDVARFLTARLDSSGAAMIREGRGTSVIPREDIWARGQIVVMAAAADDATLAEAILARADTLHAAFTAQALRYTKIDMFGRGRQSRIEEDLLLAHGFAVNVQHDYFFSHDTTLVVDGHAGHFVRLRRVLSDTWRDFFVYYEDLPSGIIDTNHVEHVTDVALETFVRGQYDSAYVALDRRRPIRTDTVLIGGRAAMQTRGLWRMTADLMGGPFVRYTFYDTAQQRLYIFFGMIYAPQHRFRGQKREFLRQIEVIARTFRTAAQVEAEE